MTAGCCGAVLVGIRPVSSLGRCMACGEQVVFIVIDEVVADPLRDFIRELLARPDVTIRWVPAQ